MEQIEFTEFLKFRENQHPCFLIILGAMLVLVFDHVIPDASCSFSFHGSEPMTLMPCLLFLLVAWADSFFLYLWVSPYLLSIIKLRLTRTNPLSKHIEHQPDQCNQFNTLPFCFIAIFIIPVEVSITTEVRLHSCRSQYYYRSQVTFL